jgi:hypothetical protein
VAKADRTYKMVLERCAGVCPRGWWEGARPVAVAAALPGLAQAAGVGKVGGGTGLLGVACSGRGAARRAACAERGCPPPPQVPHVGEAAAQLCALPGGRQERPLGGVQVLCVSAAAALRRPCGPWGRGEMSLLFGLVVPVERNLCAGGRGTGFASCTRRRRRRGQSDRAQRLAAARWPVSQLAPFK